MKELDKFKEEADNLVQYLHDVVRPVSENILNREDIWLAKRKKCYITSSKLPNLMKHGTRKEQLWGKSALDVLYGAMYQQRTGLELEPVNAYQFNWGKTKEPHAVEWLRGQTKLKVMSCTYDFPEIIFNTPFDKFGDSPDAYIYDAKGNIKAIVEIKCPCDQIKIEKYRDVTNIDKKTENYEQFLGHFIGLPGVRELWWIIYDGYANDGHIVKMLRKDHEDNIKQLIERINDGIYVINECLHNNKKISDIETILKEK